MSPSVVLLVVLPEGPSGLAMAVAATAIEALARCIQSPVLSVANRPKCLFSLAAINRYTVAIAISKSD